MARLCTLLFLLSACLSTWSGGGVRGECGIGLGDFSHEIPFHNYTLQPHMLRRSQGGLGSSAGLHKLILKLQSGQPIVMSVVGGSISKGCGGDSRMAEAIEGYPGSYSRVVFDYIASRYPHADHVYANGAKGAVGAAYFQSCLHKHLHPKADLILLDFAVNGATVSEVERVVRLILHARGGMHSENLPAIFFVNYWNHWPGRADEVAEFYNAGTGGRWVMSNFSEGVPRGDNEGNIDVVARYYDVPSLSLRHAMMFENMHATPGFAYRDIDCGGNHPNERGHRMMADVVVYALEAARVGVIHHRHLNTPSWAGWLPPTLVLGNEVETRTLACELGRPELEAAVNACWKMTHFSDPKLGLWGNVSSWRVSSVAPCLTLLRVTTPIRTISAHNTSWAVQPRVRLHLFHLLSWQPSMGELVVTCHSMCRCEPQRINGRGGEHTVEVPHSFDITPLSDHCILVLESVNGDFKVFGAAFEGDAGNHPTSTPGAAAAP